MKYFSLFWMAILIGLPSSWSIAVANEVSTDLLIHDYTELKPPRSVQYWRNHADQNPMRGFSFATPAASGTDVFPGHAKYLNIYWKKLNGDLSPVWVELQQINQRSVELEATLSSDLRNEDRAFLEWWFSHPESLTQKEKLFSVLEQSEPHFAAKLASASLRYAQWRNPVWVQKLMDFPGTLDVVLLAAISDELIDNDELNERLLATPEFKSHLYGTYFQVLLPQAKSIRASDRIKTIMNGHVQGEYGPQFFLYYGGTAPHWIEMRPDLVDLAIRGISSPAALNNLVIQKILANPQSARYPEWLEYLLKLDLERYRMVEGRLNQVLALDHWYNHPVLHRILRGNAPTATTLRWADWRPVLNRDCLSILR